MEKRKLEVGDVVQIDPDFDPRFGGCLMIVSEPTSFGCKCYIRATPGRDQDRDQGVAFYRCEFANMEYVGKAFFSQPKDEDDMP